MSARQGFDKVADSRAPAECLHVEHDLSLLCECFASFHTSPVGFQCAMPHLEGSTRWDGQKMLADFLQLTAKTR